MEKNIVLEPTEFTLNFGSDHYAKQHIEEILLDRFQKLESVIQDKYFYSISISKIPTRLNYHRFDFDTLQQISRRLTNGMNSLGLLTNRKFWNNNFNGGVRTTSVVMSEIDEFPIFSLNYLVYSISDNLDVKIQNQLLSRIKVIDPTLLVTFNFIGKISSLNEVVNKINYSTEVDYNNKNINKLGVKTLNGIYNNQYQRPRFFGQMFKL